MATFLVFEPVDGGRTQANAERVVFLREKFSRVAFLLTPFWLLAHKLWIAFTLWLAAFAAIMLIGKALGFGPYAAVAAMFFPSLLAGLEAVSLRAKKLLRSGYRDAGVVIADDLETAERRFFETWKRETTPANQPPAGGIKTDYPYPPQSAPPAQPNMQVASANETGVIGLFPTRGA